MKLRTGCDLELSLDITDLEYQEEASGSDESLGDVVVTGFATFYQYIEHNKLMSVVSWMDR